MQAKTATLRLEKVFLTGSDMKPRGFTIFFAVLVASLSLAIGLAIYELLIRELDLSQTARESQYAIYAADTGAECALYWDNKAPLLNGATSVFATSSQVGNSNPPSSNVWCNEQDIAAAAVTALTWPESEAALTATSKFQVLLDEADPDGPCAIVEVIKTADVSGEPPATQITSSGRNTCNFNAPLQIERTLEVNY